MQRSEALALLYEALVHCEGIPEVKDVLKIDVVKTQQLMEEHKLVEEQDASHNCHVYTAIGCVLGELG